ncbi:MAG: single-stranded-DNA-specific exonuclease RecJ [Gammaproteobacteria bacterium]|nr:single-stranded-DNA-specific exonuclease RecJ [Gammaproteobacteria bacterium]
MNLIIKRRAFLPPFPGCEDIPLLLQRIYSSRQINHPDQLDYSLARLLPFTQLKGIDKALELLTVALQGQQSVLIVGDFDADGATSTALAIKALRAFGFRNINYLVPNRFEYGYGLTPEIVEVALQFSPELIITVDNGISSIEGVAAAQTAGVKVLITDHHLAGNELPQAEAIVNPNQPGDSFASKSLAGVGVMFYVLMALRTHLREINWFKASRIKEPNLAQWLDLVALGTVADVVPLDHNNRILVAQGLARIQAGQACMGIQALAGIAGRDLAQLSSSDIGFFIGPRLNAAGRLEDMSLGIECLLTEDRAEARKLAQQLDSLNQERRVIEQDMKQQALAMLELMQFDDEALPVGLCLFEPDWHEGIVGILASRIKDRLHRPVIAFARTAAGQIKGSARSVKGLHIRDVLDAVATRQPHLLHRFGGHAMAAGLTLAEENYPVFEQAFDEEVRRHLSAERLQGVLESDGELMEEEFSLEMALNLRQAGPWGQAFEEPLFDGVFELLERRIVAEKHLKMRLKHADVNTPFDAIAFNITDEHWGGHVQKVKMAYKLDVNEYRGERSLQCIVHYLEPLS